MLVPRPHRALIEESTLLIDRARRAVAASRLLLGSSALLLAPVPRPKPFAPRMKGYADLAAWKARKR
jgi:hypothetical protein